VDPSASMSMAANRKIPAHFFYRIVYKLNLSCQKFIYTDSPCHLSATCTTHKHMCKYMCVFNMHTVHVYIALSDW
jgi:hypothetical protein